MDDGVVIEGNGRSQDEDAASEFQAGVVEYQVVGDFNIVGLVAADTSAATGRSIAGRSISSDNGICNGASGTHPETDTSGVSHFQR